MSSQLFTPLQLRHLTLSNRLIVSPMCQYSAVDGNAQDWHLIHLGHLALGGMGMLMIEATAVEARGRITPGCLGIYSDENEAALKRVITGIRKYSAMPIGIQLAHAGRKGLCHVPWVERGSQIPHDKGGWTNVAPSALAYHEGERAPVALTQSDIEQLPNLFVQAAERALRLGLDSIELHAAHGYLLHQFLSPLSNQRKDTYGGSLENRMRLPLEVFEAIRAIWPKEKPLGVRVSATDWVEGGWDIAQTIAFAQELKKRGCDWIDCSSGGLDHAQKIPATLGYQVPFAQQIREATGIPTIAVGLIISPEQAEEIIATGQADMVAMARAILFNPRMGWTAAVALGGTVKAPSQYLRAGYPNMPKIFIE